MRPQFVNMRMMNRRQAGRSGRFPGHFQLKFAMPQGEMLLNLTWNKHMEDTAEVVIGTGPGKKYMKRWKSKGQVAGWVTC